MNEVSVVGCLLAAEVAHHDVLGVKLVLEHGDGTLLEIKEAYLYLHLTARHRQQYHVFVGALEGEGLGGAAPVLEMGAEGVAIDFPAVIKRAHGDIAGAFQEQRVEVDAATCPDGKADIFRHKYLLARGVAGKGVINAQGASVEVVVKVDFAAGNDG